MERARTGLTAARTKDARHLGRRGAPSLAVVHRTGWGGVTGDGTAVLVQALSEMGGGGGSGDCTGEGERRCETSFRGRTDSL